MALSPWLLALSGFPPESSNGETSSFVSNAEEEARRVAMMTKAQRENLVDMMVLGLMSYEFRVLLLCAPHAKRTLWHHFFIQTK